MDVQVHDGLPRRDARIEPYVVAVGAKLVVELAFHLLDEGKEGSLFFWCGREPVGDEPVSVSADAGRMLMRTPLPQGWWGIDLEPYRHKGGTYSLLSMSEIPPLDESLFQGDFRWLPRLHRSVYEEVDRYDELQELQRQTDALGFCLPEPFVRFMGGRALRDAIYSGSACYWDLSRAAVPSRLAEGTWAIRFLNDQQGVLFWYLLLGPGVDGQILCSPDGLDNADFVDSEVLDECTCLCAPHFEHFIYRFWMENELLAALHERRAMTPEQEAYLVFYSR